MEYVDALMFAAFIVWLCIGGGFLYLMIFHGDYFSELIGAERRGVGLDSIFIVFLWRVFKIIFFAEVIFLIGHWVFKG